MQPGPSKRMEATAALLIPPACREEVLGDLYERYKSRSRYILDVAGTAPLVVWSQIRRTADPRTFALESVAVFLALLAAQWITAGPSDFLRLAIPSVVTLIALRIAAVYSRRPWVRILAVLFAASFQADVPFWILILGGCLAVLLMAVVNGLEKPTPAPGGAITLDELRRRTLEFQVKVSQRNFREYVAAGVVCFFAALNFSGEPVASALTLAGVAYLVYYLRTRGSARTAPLAADFATWREFHRTELSRQRDLLRAIWFWYLGPLIPGMLVVAIRRVIADPTPRRALSIGFVLLIFFGIAKLNHAGARMLQRRIDELDTLEAQP